MDTIHNITSFTLVTEDGLEKAVRIFGTIYDPHFCGKDICDILEITDFKQALKDIVQNIHKKELKYLLDEENNAPLPPSWLGVLKTPALLGSIDPENISYHDGRLVVLSEPGVYDLLNGTRKRKNKEILRDAISKAIYTIKYKDSAGLMDIFSFISRLNLAIDIGSNWFHDLWYPLSKSRGPPGGAPGRVENQPQHPIILTENLFEWLGYKGRKQADKQEKFSRFLESLKIPYEEIDYKHPLAIEYPGIQEESKQLVLSKNLNKKKWLCLDQRAFKKVVMRLNTENADVVRDYYLNLEEAMFAYGEYTMEYVIQQRDKEMAIAMEQLAIKDKSEEELQKQLEQEKHRAEKAEKEAEEQRQYALILKELAVNDQKRPINEVIYISTSKAYAANNRHKVGGVEGMDKLKSRFAGYNGRSSVDDMWYYSDIFKVANFRAAEKRIEDVLGRFRERKNKEMYVLHYDDLRRYVEWICKHYEDEIVQFNEELDVLICGLNRHNKEPVIPPPYQGTSATITRIVNGIPSTTTIEDSIEGQFKHKIKVYLDTLESTTKEVKRTDLFSKVDMNFNKIEGWRWLKEIIPQYKPDIKLNYR